MSKQVFISYSHDDKVEAEAICRQLEAASIPCWIAPRDISPSKDWAEAIIDAINSVDVMVLVLSSHSNSSPQVRREVERAVHKGVDILPFRIEDVLPSKSLEFFISTQHWLDATSGSLDHHLNELHRSVTSIIASGEREPDSTATLPAPAAAPARTVSVAPAFSASELKYVSVHLANYLGPVAKVLVKKRASQATSLKGLIDLLSNELEDDRERGHFVQSCLSIVDD